MCTAPQGKATQLDLLEKLKGKLLPLSNQGREAQQQQTDKPQPAFSCTWLSLHARGALLHLLQARAKQLCLPQHPSCSL